MLAEQNHKKLHFFKMNGAKNDFVIFDARKQEINLSKDQIKKISSRKHIGCDQLIIIKKDEVADCLMEIYNSDGSLAGACGNATRCVAFLLKKEKSKIKTAAGILDCEINEELILVKMANPKFLWQEIPLTKEIDTKKISLEGFEFGAVNIGNPHVVSFIEKPLSDEKFFEIAPKIENNPLFKEKTNVEFAQIISNDLINARVWERGAQETLACGSGACAVGILAIKNGLINKNKTRIRFKGGDLIIEYNQKTNEVIMMGDCEIEFEGFIDESFF